MRRIGKEKRGKEEKKEEKRREVRGRKEMNGRIRKEIEGKEGRFMKREGELKKMNKGERKD